ncbi:MAG: AraC family transcriptional regulator [Lachnospiraceae bacterium]|nr:AraC family transcriptional regulator [Lachnospiraceae bacterium]
MKSFEEYVSPESDYFIYSPSRMALDMFLYPLQCGFFSYLPGYSLTRESFDSFLLMYIQKGGLSLTFEGTAQCVTAGHFVLLDCYKLHSYSTTTGWECIWCHFDSITARSYYNSIVSRLGNVFSMPDTYPVLKKLTAILKIFDSSALVQEPLLSKYLTDIFTEFLLYTPMNVHSRDYAVMAEETITYINEHFREDITVEELAYRAGLSQYHFIRIFKKETGFTPHEYLVNTRIATARYLLKNSRLPVKDICYATGFSSESVFCGAFKRRQGMTPNQYRSSEQG